MKHLKKYNESLEEIHWDLEMFKSAITFASEHNVDMSDMIECVNELINTDKDGMREIYDSLKGNFSDAGVGKIGRPLGYRDNNSSHVHKDRFMLALIQKYCNEIWY